MTDARGAGTAPPSTTATAAAARDRPGLRGTLLSLAVAVLLLGAATAGAYGYAAIIHLR